MKAQFAVLTAVVSAGAGLVTWQLTPASTALAGDGILQAASATAVVVLAEDYEYVGSSKCKKCHIKAHRSWKKTKMGQAFETLKPGKAAEVKKKFNLDPEKDYTQDTSCLVCHTTGHGHAGGYVVPDPTDKKAVRKAKKLQGAGCESCHGPGRAHVMAPAKNRMPFAGEKSCATCHVPEHSPGFTFEEYWPKISH